MKEDGKYRIYRTITGYPINREKPFQPAAKNQFPGH
jgi:hypothetical protein